MESIMKEFQDGFSYPVEKYKDTNGRTCYKYKCCSCGVKIGRYFIRRVKGHVMCHNCRKEMNKMKRCKKFCITGIVDAMDYIMWNRKELLDEITLLWRDDTKYEMRLIMNRPTANEICFKRNPRKVMFSFINMTLMDIPMVFDEDVVDDIVILEVEEKKKPCIGLTTNQVFFDEFIGISKTRLNSFYGIPTDLRLKIKEVIYNPPATIIKWQDGTKTVVKCQDGEIFDKEKGFAMAFLKKALGNEGRYYDTVKKWVPIMKAEKAPTKVTKFVSVKEFAKIAGMAESTVRHHCIDGRIKGAVKNEEGFWRIPIDVYPEGTLIEHLKGGSDELTGYPI